MEIRRGDVVICAAPGEYGKPRPAVVVQSDLFNGTHSSVTVCLITGHLVDAPPYRFPVRAGRTTGLKVQSQVMVDKVIAIPRNKITSQVIPCSSRLSCLLLRRARALRLPLLGFSFQLSLQLFGMCSVVGFPTSIDGLPRKGGRVGGVEVLATVPASLPAESHGCVINHGPSIAPKRCVSQNYS